MVKKPAPLVRLKKRPKTKKAKSVAPIEERPIIAPQEVKEEPERAELKVRKNALQVKQETENEELEMLEKEEFWQTPAFLRKKIDK